MENGIAFENPEDPKLPYNTAYINLSLLDELDYVVGGYGKPNQAFIFSLNNFVETYVLNEIFFFSVLEWNHFILTNKSILTKGRPIRNILFKTGDRIVFKDWSKFINSKVLYAKQVVKGVDDTQFCVEEFQKTATEEIKKKFFKPAIFLEPDQQYSYLTRNFGFDIIPENTYIVYDIKQSPTQLLEGLYKDTASYNYQVALPFSGLKAQFNFNNSLLPSNQSYKILSEIHNQKIETLSSYTGYKKIPVPPLVSILLSQCTDLSDIPIKLQQLREDFTDLRNSFTELEKKIDSSENLKEQMDAVDGLQDFWKAFNRKYTAGNNRLMHHFWDIKKAANIENAAEKVLDSGEVEGFLSNLNAISVAGKVFGKAHNFLKDKKSLNRFKGITNLWELLQKTPTLENQAKDYERIFKVKIDLKELNKLHEQMRNYY